MKFTRILVIAMAVVGSIFMSGCSGSGQESHGPADDANAQIKAMRPEDRFKMIKEQTALSLEQKEIAVDNLPVSDDQKTKWKEELRQSGASKEAKRPGQ